MFSSVCLIRQQTVNVVKTTCTCTRASVFVTMKDDTPNLPAGLESAAEYCTLHTAPLSHVVATHNMALTHSNADIKQVWYCTILNGVVLPYLSNINIACNTSEKLLLHHNMSY